MGSSEDMLNPFSRSEELLEMIQKGKSFTEELLRENERLRLRVLQAEKDRIVTGGIEEMERLRAENERLRNENHALREQIELIDRRFSEVESENQDFARRYVEVEAQNEALANLYVASYQLHATLDPSEVTQSIMEVIVGLIGAEEFAIMMVDEETNELVMTAGEGVDARFPTGRITIGEGIEGRAAATGQMYFGEAGTAEEQVAAVPLMLKGECVGVIGIYRMLSQKKGGFTPVDHELLSLLAGQAATALMSSRLYAAKDRRLKTMEGFMKLLREN